MIWKSVSPYCKGLFAARPKGGSKTMFLAIDAGGTTVRAVALDAHGRTHGHGRAGGGNPTAVGIPSAVASIAQAVEQALTGLDLSATGPCSGVITMAGERSPAYLAQLSARLSPLGVVGIDLMPDLLGIFHSGTHQQDGYALIAGTGSVAARVREGQLDRVVGGRGWLLGDAGSGFWIGHRVAQAVTADLDGQGPHTALTALVLTAVAVAPPQSPADRARVAAEFVSRVYASPPVRLADLAPLAFRAFQDPVAQDILVAASAALAGLLSVVQVAQLAGPVVVGGSVLVRGLLGGPDELRAVLVPLMVDAPVIRVSDGVVGAAVLALRAGGIDVDAALFSTLRHQVSSMSRSVG